MQPGGEVPHGTTNQADDPPATGRRHDDDDGKPPLLVYQSKRRRQKKTEEEEEGQDAMGSLPEDSLRDILSRLSYRCICRFKCVSTPWLALCSAPDVRKASTQTLSGFFHNYLYSEGNLRFRNLNGTSPPMVDPALPFLMRGCGGGGGYTRFKVMHCSTSLLLCKCWKKCGPEGDEVMELIVCNPATEEWIVLPPIYLLPKEHADEEEDEDEDDYEEEDEEEEEEEYEGELEEEVEEKDGDEDGDLTPFIPEEAYLGFDAKSPSCFVVFVPRLGRLGEMVVYSSKTTKWIRARCNAGSDPVTAECVLLNGFMHMVMDADNIVALDTKFYHRIPLPRDLDMEPGTINTLMGQSQGLLHTWYIRPGKEELFVWVLRNYDSKKWTLKYSVELGGLFDTIEQVRSCEVLAIHPEKNVIFLTDCKKTTISYDVDKRKKHVMCNSGEFLDGSPYIPFFGKWMS